MHFRIDNQYLTQITVRATTDIYEKTGDPETDVFNKLVSSSTASSYSSEDHPEFDRLRRELGRLGYIRIESGWWNGDSVLKPFTLNDAQFRVNDKFCCGAAIASSIKSKTERNFEHD
jgi:hypothetical protein